jgi:CRISPR system Cascade subunit CasD
MRWLILRLVAPMASFGGEAVDARGVTRDFPAASAITGLLANALGFDRTDRAALDALQSRLIFAARRENEPVLGRMTDFQTAQLGAADQGWTTRGAVEGRAGGAATYQSPHIRSRDYHADTSVTVVLRLDPADSPPTLDDLAAALDRPARPLFIGRKSCLPAGYLNGGYVDATTARVALETVHPLLPPSDSDSLAPLRALWPEGDGDGGHPVTMTDQRNWTTGLHGGSRHVRQGLVTPIPADP